jgi:predicted secreted hydrolase
MTKKIFIILILFLILSGELFSQIFKFPEDEGKHKDVDAEAWIIFAHFKDNNGDRISLSFTILDGDIFIGIDIKAVLVGIFHNKYGTVHRFSDVIIPLEGGVNHTIGKLDEKYKKTRLKREGTSNIYTLHSEMEGYKMDLKFTVVKPVVQMGRVALGGGKFGFAYYFTNTSVEGEIFLNNKSLKVKGTGIIEHLWGESPPTNVITNSFIIHLQDNTEIMVSYLQEKDGTINPGSFVLVIYPDGKHKVFHKFNVKAEGKWKSSESGIEYTSGWTITCQDANLNIKINPSLKNQEVIIWGQKYWEGNCLIKANLDGKTVDGNGYVYLKGY